MGVYGWFITFVGAALLALRGLNLSWFVVDWIVVTLYFIFSIPFFAKFLKKAKFPGTEFEFKDTIEKTKKALIESHKSVVHTDFLEGVADQSNSQTIHHESSASKRAKELFVEIPGKKDEDLSDQFFDLSGARAILESDPVLALAALRIEIERKLKKWSQDSGESTENYSLYKIIKLYKDKDWINSVQIEALQNIIKMCNNAVHGAEITYDIAANIIDLAAEINKTFRLGYSTDFTPLDNFEKYGLSCPWEHCIENMPLENGAASCPLWGHDCPGGEEQVILCKDGD